VLVVRLHDRVVELNGHAARLNLQVNLKSRAVRT
jgi:hypothetical protein